MSVVFFFNRVMRKLRAKYRKLVFRKLIHCAHSDFSLVENVLVINRNIRLGHHVTLYPGVMFFGDGLIEIGNNVDIGNGTLIYASKNGGVKIGDNSVIAAQSYIIDMDHGVKAGELIRKQPNTVLPVCIGEDVWIAAGCKILKGSQVGNGAIIGAASVVKGVIPENAIAVGIPAKVKKYREQ